MTDPSQKEDPKALESDPADPEAPQQVSAPEEPEEPVAFLDRELSWLAFNGRVLQEASDPRVPLFDQLNFLAIFYANLDEFFRVRVAGLRSLLRLKKKKLKKLRFRPRKLLRDIHFTVMSQQETFGSIFRGGILPALEANGIFLLNDRDLTTDQAQYLRYAFRDVIQPYLEPAILRREEPPPFLEAGGIYLVCELWPGTEMTLASERPEYGILRIPSPPLPRFMKAPGEGLNVLFLEDAIRLSLGEIFPRFEVGSAYAVKLSRDADLYLEDEFGGDLVQKIRKSLDKRKTGLPARFLYDLQAPYALISFLKEHLGLEDDDLVPGGRYHNLQDLAQFPRPLGSTALARKELLPLPHPVLQDAESVFSAVEKRDQVLHFPYQSFQPVIRFLREAAEDPTVDRIWITLYRVAEDSEVVKALIRAAENGIRVQAFVEVKARFDEALNLKWAQEMAEAGVHTVYSMPGIKVHAKLALVSREREGTRQLFSYLSTGNFNEKTARIYCDHGLLTADPRITEDVEEVFRFLWQETESPSCTHLLVAPFQLREGLGSLMGREVGAAAAGEPCGVVLKINSLEDEGMMEDILRLGNARVPTNLIVRGICRLPLGPGGRLGSLKGRSIVDRFLEHARVFRFVQGGNPVLLLSSADLMRRNLKRRVEVAFPIFDSGIREELDQLLHFQLSDNTKARVLDASLENTYVGRRVGEPRVQAQADFYRWLEDRLEP